jgi:hypothetical protein
MEPKLHKPQGGLGRSYYCQRQNYDPHSSLSYYLVHFNDLPFSFLLILFRLFIEITKETWLMHIKSN